MRSLSVLAGFVALSGCAIIPDSQNITEAPVTQREECFLLAKTVRIRIERAIKAMEVPDCIRARINKVAAEAALADIGECISDPEISERMEFILAALSFADIAINNSCPDRYGF